MALTRERSIARSFSGAARERRGSCILWIAIVTGCENDAVTARRLALFTPTIFTFVLFGWVSIMVALEKILEILEGILVEIALTMACIVLDVFLWDLEKNKKI